MRESVKHGLRLYVKGYSTTFDSAGKAKISIQGAEPYNSNLNVTAKGVGSSSSKSVDFLHEVSFSSSELNQLKFSCTRERTGDGCRVSSSGQHKGNYTTTCTAPLSVLRPEKISKAIINDVGDTIYNSEGASASVKVIDNSLVLITVSRSGSHWRHHNNSSHCESFSTGLPTINSVKVEYKH